MKNPVTGEVTGVTFSAGLLWGTLIIAFVLAIATAFMPKTARFTSLPYALFEGVVLGMISRMYEVQFDGIVVQAILATAGVFLMMLVLYGLRILRATPRFVKGVIAATFGIMVLYLVGFIFSLFGSGFSFWNDASLLGIGISVVICIVAALNLILDFDFIEKGVAAKAAGLHGLVRRVRPRGHPGLALPRDAAPAVQAPPVTLTGPGPRLTCRWCSSATARSAGCRSRTCRRSSPARRTPGWTGSRRSTRST